MDEYSVYKEVICNWSSLEYTACHSYIYIVNVLRMNSELSLYTETLLLLFVWKLACPSGIIEKIILLKAIQITSNFLVTNICSLLVNSNNV